MALKPEISLSLALATGVMVWGIYQHAMPSLADHRVGDIGDVNAAKAERTATWTAAGIVSAVSLIARDPTIFVVGGLEVVILSFWHRHANMVNPLTGRATAPAAQRDVTPTVMDVQPADSMAYAG